jgi:hypothetical protein
MTRQIPATMPHRPLASKADNDSGTSQDSDAIVATVSIRDDAGEEEQEQIIVDRQICLKSELLHISFVSIMLHEASRNHLTLNVAFQIKPNFLSKQGVCNLSLPSRILKRRLRTATVNSCQAPITAKKDHYHLVY